MVRVFYTSIVFLCLLHCYSCDQMMDEVLKSFVAQFRVIDEQQRDTLVLYKYSSATGKYYNFMKQFFRDVKFSTVTLDRQISQDILGTGELHVVMGQLRSDNICSLDSDFQR